MSIRPINAVFPRMESLQEGIQDIPILINGKPYTWRGVEVRKSQDGEKWTFDHSIEFNNPDDQCPPIEFEIL